MKYRLRNRRSLTALAMLSVLSGLSVLPVSAQTTASGFLSDYTRLEKAGPLRDRHLSYSDPQLAGRTIRSLYVSPVVRFPVDARFEGIDETLVSQLLAHADTQLRTKLGARYKLTTLPDQADGTLKVALTNVAAHQEGKTVVDLVPMRLVTGTLKDAALGKSLEATATFEIRLNSPGIDQPWHEALHVVKGKTIGRADNAKTHVTFESLAAAIDRWASELSDQITSKP